MIVPDSKVTLLISVMPSTLKRNFDPRAQDAYMRHIIPFSVCGSESANTAQAQVRHYAHAQALMERRMDLYFMISSCMYDN